MLREKEDKGMIGDGAFMFGSLEGSIGQVIQIPKECFQFLNRLQEVMEANLVDITRLPKSEHRKVRHENGDPESHFHVIDGDFVEQFLDLPSKAQCVVLQNMLLNINELGPDYLKEVKDLLVFLKSKH
uniref:RSE1/DDB1/CPSF1 C-terminal domain-containing protein n=1 Tax=Strombidium inclinatum TaxID=197538 RepID=A0A7S3IX43_9SPIT|mmetsp:Transcript_42699/g.65537  ORF Transcript_42699/g.65537 Transcript_42699/m.65537 type:complete len:128 (+) Transcript_42699:4325-4708(+)